MLRVNETVWGQLVAAYEAADAEADAAYEIYDREPEVANDDGEPSEAEQQYEALRAVANEHEERLLGVIAPTAAAATYQLQLYGLRYAFVDLAQGPIGPEDPEAAILRRIYAGLTSTG